MPPTFEQEKKLWGKGLKVVIGSDEVGRGAWAGPVVAAAVVFEPPQLRSARVSPASPIIDDSKKLRPRQRERAALWIKESALAWGVGEISPGVINRAGIAKATRMAFRKAINACSMNYESRIKNRSSSIIHNSEFNIQFLLIDAFYLPYMRGLRRKNQLAIKKGDECSVSIAAASILAKVYRDALMRRVSYSFPEYGWGTNKGYGTRKHQEAIRRVGLCPLHRKSFVPKGLLA